MSCGFSASCPRKRTKAFPHHPHQRRLTLARSYLLYCLGSALARRPHHEAPGETFPVQVRHCPVVSLRGNTGVSPVRPGWTVCHHEQPTFLYRIQDLSLIHISEPTRLGMISYAVFCLKKKKKTT